MKTNQVYIEGILDSIRKIENFTRGVTKEVFVENQEKQSAVILHLILIGENANKISQEMRSHIDLPWRNIIGLRNVAVHEYMDLELNVIWDTVIYNIPKLKEKLEKFQ